MGATASRIGALAQNAAKDYDLHLVPWASIAANVSSDATKVQNAMEGSAFCFLPLPAKTDLPVHVNGYFELSSNRRDIWYGQDMDRGGKLRSDWNVCLLEDVVASAFAQLLLEASRRLGHSSLYYSLWPTGNFSEPWLTLVTRLFSSVAGLPVLHTPTGGDVIDEEAAAVLQGLPLVPLSDGGWAVFGRRGKGNVFVCNELECKIFQSLPSKVVSRKIPGMVLSRLESIAHLSSTNLCPLTEVFLLEMLPYLMPAEWRNQDEVEWSANECRGTSTPPFDHNLHDLESVEFAGGRSFGKYGKDCWPP
ncbi:sacsin [Marchantia polymorpha subsp. ruderalis]|nr:hypothetical protein Mp_2g18230 [Marchantia polymorpha subsp. ruderalis]